MAWIPANPVHAIDRATIKFEFGALPAKPRDRVFGLIRDSVAKFGLTELSTIPSQSNPIQISLDPQSGEIVNPGSIKPLWLNAFIKKGPDNKPLEEVILANDYFAINIFSYDNWDNISGRIAEYFEASVEYLTNEIEGISAIRFEYWDRFSRQSGSKDQFVNPNCIILGQLFGDLQGSWHSHVGLFKTIQNLNLLLNANVDIISIEDSNKGLFQMPAIQENTDMLCRIYTMAIMRNFSNTIFPSFAECHNAANIGHDELKALIGNIVTPELARRINLNAGEFSV